MKNEKITIGSSERSEGLQSEARVFKAKRGSSMGFSLIELIFAMSFLTIIILGVASLQTSNLAMMSGNNNQIQAHFYANQGLQIVKALGYTAIQSVCTPPPTEPCYMVIKPPSSGNYSLEKKQNSPEEIDTIPFERIIKAESAGLTNAYKVTAMIEWTDSTGEHREKEGTETVNGHVQAKLIISKP